jgi:hypothetical protein
LDNPTNSEVTAISKIDTRVVDTLGYLGIVHVSGNSVKSVQIDFNGKNFNQIKDFTLTSAKPANPRISDHSVYANTRGDVIYAGQKLT